MTGVREMWLTPPDGESWVNMLNTNIFGFFKSQELKYDVKNLI